MKIRRGAWPPATDAHEHSYLRRMKLKSGGKRFAVAPVTDPESELQVILARDMRVNRSA